MARALTSPLSAETIAELRAGDTVALTGSILVLDLRTTSSESSIDSWFAKARTAGDGWLCCFARAPLADEAGQTWTVAAINDPGADRLACSVLAAGSRGLVCLGKCLGTTSYALRKYGGVCFRATERWSVLRDMGDTVGPSNRDHAALLTIHSARVVVSQDAQGRQVAADD